MRRIFATATRGSGYVLGAVLMIAGGLIAILLAVNAERRSLEDIARPLTAVRGRDAAPAGAPAK